MSVDEDPDYSEVHSSGSPHIRQRRRRMVPKHKHHLIGLVREQSELWDKMTLMEMSKEGKLVIWREISRRLNAQFSSEYTVDAVIDTWENVKDCLVRHRKALDAYQERINDNELGGPNEIEPTWEFYGDLGFLVENQDAAKGATPVSHAGRTPVRKRRSRMDKDHKHFMIGVVYQMKELWQKEERTLMPKQKRMKSWSTVTDVINHEFSMNYSKEMVYDTWVNIRECLGRFRKRIDLYEAEPDPEKKGLKPQWDYYADVWFLEEQEGRPFAMPNSVEYDFSTLSYIMSKEPSCEYSRSEQGKSYSGGEEEDTFDISKLLLGREIKPEIIEQEELPFTTRSIPISDPSVFSPHELEGVIIREEAETLPKPLKKPRIELFSTTPNDQSSTFTTCFLCSVHAVSDNMRELNVTNDKTSTLAIRMFFADRLEDMRIASPWKTTIHICENHLCDIYETDHSVGEANDKIILNWSCTICGVMTSVDQLKKIYKRNAAFKIEKKLSLGTRLSSSKEWPLRICGKHIANSDNEY